MFEETKQPQQRAGMSRQVAHAQQMHEGACDQAEARADVLRSIEVGTFVPKSSVDLPLSTQIVQVDKREMLKHSPDELACFLREVEDCLVKETKDAAAIRDNLQAEIQRWRKSVCITECRLVLANRNSC